MDDPVHEQEDFYDSEIAPALKILRDKCNEKGMAFICNVSFLSLRAGDGCAPPDEPYMSGGYTVYMPEKPDAAARVNYYAVKSNGNLDRLIGSLKNDCRKYGHGSIFMHQLGVPTAAERAKP